MTAKLLAISLMSLGLGGMSCSDKVSNRDNHQTACMGLSVEICRETYPGVFKLDLVDTCYQGAGRTPEENEVPMSYCKPCQEIQTRTTAELDVLMDEGTKCETDDDCAVVYLTPTCDFGCGGAFNARFDTGRYDEIVAERNSCTLCEEKSCQQTTSLLPPVCEKGRCQVSRSPSSN